MAFETVDRSELYPNQPGSAWLARIGACTLGLHIESKEILSMHWNMHLQKHRKIRGLDSRPKICWKNGFFNRKPWLLDRRTSEPPVGFKALLARAKPSAKPRKDGWQMLWYHVGVPKIGLPQNVWFMMENPYWNGWFGGYHYFRKHPCRCSGIVWWFDGMVPYLAKQDNIFFLEPLLLLLVIALLDSS